MSKERTSQPARHKSCSQVQRDAEKAIVDAFLKREGLTAQSAPEALERIQLDRFAVTSEGQRVLIECYARVGKTKSGHRRKIMMDAAKLHLANTILGGDCRLVFLVQDADCVAHLEGSGWQARYFKALGIHRAIVDPGRGVREAVVAAQERQKR